MVFRFVKLPGSQKDPLAEVSPLGFWNEFLDPFLLMIPFIMRPNGSCRRMAPVAGAWQPLFTQASCPVSLRTKDQTQSPGCFPRTVREMTTVSLHTPSADPVDVMVEDKRGLTFLTYVPLASTFRTLWGKNSLRLWKSASDDRA